MASRIQRLPPDIAEKIAAGEVVERPFSVVKELVENSLDAGASRIEIFVEDGGRKLIRVQDDGYGMTPEEMGLALERHATSKIQSFDDLFSITSLGFRGEALPSLTAVSRFTLKSRLREEGRIAGFEIALEGGKILHQRETGAPVGTTVEVKDLFYNTPARLKFLKSNETEWGHIEDYLTGMALAYPEVQFGAFHNGKEKIRWMGRGAKQRLHEIFGGEVADGFYPLSGKRGEIQIEGYVGHPNLSHSQTNSLLLFLNRRLIKDRLLNHAVMSGYRNLLMKDQFPRVILFLEIPPRLVDVNVHPTKREVRFVQPNAVHQFVSETIARHLSKAPWTKYSQLSPSPQSPPIEGGEGQIRSPALRFPSPLVGEGGGEGTSGLKMGQQWFSQNFQPLQETAAFTHIGRLPFSSLSVIGQLKGTYILCQSEEHFVLLDQHAAHERIGFERLKAQARTGGIAVQRFLSPQLIEIREVEMENVKPLLDSLEKLGLLIEEFGPKTLAVKGAPALLGSVECEPLVRDLLREIQEHGQSTKLEDRLDEIFATMACHRQIRAGDALTLREMEELVKELDEGAYGYHCPHGRPVMVQISFREIEKWFKRIL